VTHQIRLTSAASRDLGSVRQFLQSENRTAAERAVKVLTAVILSLENLPDRGRQTEDGYRELVAPFGRYGYVIRYRVEPGIVIVGRILHGRQER
jgi:plasmid stabilization system protein ParE